MQAEPQDIHEQAAAWVVRLNDDEAVIDGQALDDWRTADPAHARAFEDALASWTLLGEHAAAPELLSLRRDALDRARGKKTKSSSARRFRPLAIAACLALVVAAPLATLGWLKGKAPVEEVFQTARGEQRVIVLSDGSRMSLDALTEVRVAYTADVRSVALDRGRANFEVAKDVERPMKVRAGARVVTALGTQFTVERQSQDVLVTLLEGKVAVTSRESAMRPLEMRPGQQLWISQAGEITLREGVDIDQALAWRDGKLIFDNEKLGVAALRMNNYSTTPIVIEGRARDLRISGVFMAGDTNAFIDAMEIYFPLKVVRSQTAITINVREDSATPRLRKTRFTAS